MSDDPNEGNIESTVMHAHEAAAEREKKDPEVGREPISLWAFFLCAGALLAGGSYLGATSGGFNFTNFTVSGYEPQPPFGVEGGGGGEKDPVKEWLKAGKRVFATCQGCHQQSGLGVPGKYPPLVGSEWVLSGTERIAQIILNGLSGPIEVNGKPYGSEAMIGLKDKMSDEQIAQVMSYIRFAWENGIETIVTTEQVAAAREKYADRTTAWTVAELAPADAELPGGQAPAPEAGEESEGGAEPEAEPPAN